MSKWKWFNWLGLVLLVVGVVCIVLGLISGVAGELYAGILIVISSIGLIRSKKIGKEENSNT